jgi:hypothetical protein
MKRSPCSLLMLRSALALLALAAILAMTARPVLSLAADESATPSLPESGREVVVTGELVETGCFVMSGRRGAEHRQCAIACARAGQPLGVLEDKTSTLWLAIFDRTDAAPDPAIVNLLSGRVEVRGTAIERGGVNAILVKRVRSLSPPRDGR